MRLHEVLDGATEGTQIRRVGWDTCLIVNKYGVIYNDENTPAVFDVDAARATDWERVPTEADIEALRMAMLEAAQAAMLAQYGNRAQELRAWESAKAAYEAAKGA